MATLDLLSHVEIDHETIVVTVRETRMRRGWFRNHVTQSEKSYVCLVPHRVWLDGDRVVPSGTELALRLWEIAVSKLAEKRIDRFVELDAPLYTLPPCPAPLLRR